MVRVPPSIVAYDSGIKYLLLGIFCDLHHRSTKGYNATTIGVLGTNADTMKTGIVILHIIAK